MAMANLIVESYQNSSVNSILDDIAKKYNIDTFKDQLKNDIPVNEIKFKYRTYSECIRMLYNAAGLSKTKD
jgi:uncharacterized protein involved in type VI secretion and phage assembly